MILVDHQIEQLCINYQMVVPFDKKMINPTSLDIRMGNHAKIMDGEGNFLDIDLSVLTEDNPYNMFPGSRMLIASLETFNMPDTVCALFFLKSSRAREFIEHVHAGFCDSGWHGSKLTMELINFSDRNFLVYPGKRIGQMLFLRTAATPNTTYKITGRYNNDDKATRSKG